VEGPKEPVIVATRGGAIITIPAVAADKRSPISISAVISDVTGIMEIALNPIRDLAKIKIEISKLDTKPDSVDAPPKTTYRYYEIKAENMTEDDLSNATITFKIDKVFIGTKYNASTVTMMRHVSGGWVSLDTEMLSQTTTEYIFKATTPGFSYFAITVAELEAPPVISPPPTNGTTTEPGPISIDWTLVIWALGIIVVVAVAVVANNMLKHKKKWKPRSPR
jgi:PGF-pre-PGF domain-containing protein